MVENNFWKKEREEREKKAQELEEQRKREKPDEQVEDEPVRKEEKEEKEEYQIPTFNNYDNLPHYYFETSLLEKIKISLLYIAFVFKRIF